MHISDLLETQYASVTTDSPILVVAELLLKNDVSSVIVLDQAGHVQGIISEYDIIDQSIPQYMKSMGDLSFIDDFRPFYKKLARQLQLPVSQLMRPALCLKPDASVLEAAFLMVTHHCEVIPVVDDQHKLLGVVTRNQVLSLALQAGLEQAGGITG